MKQYKTVLSIAGSDSGGGAGIQADIKAISACGGFATTAITAVTAQNTLGVIDIHAVPTAILIKQIEAVLTDIGSSAIKIGMLHNRETILSVYTTLQKFSVTNVVLDPVMVATSGHKLLKDCAINTLKELLIPQATIITPNIPEAEILLETAINDESDLTVYAKKLGDLFGVSVLLKSGHLTSKVLTDVFYNATTGKVSVFEMPRIETKNTHGTGCSLSSALATFLACGHELDVAVKKAISYIHASIKTGADYQIGKGHGAICHFHELDKFY